MLIIVCNDTSKCEDLGVDLYVAIFAMLQEMSQTMWPCLADLNQSCLGEGLVLNDKWRRKRNENGIDGLVKSGTNTWRTHIWIIFRGHCVEDTLTLHLTQIQSFIFYILRTDPQLLVSFILFMLQHSLLCWVLQILIIIHRSQV